MNQLSKKQIQKFQQKIYDFYATNRRSFEWREHITPYRVVVSEIMLQQTQTARVKVKFAEWIQKFPDLKSLSQASKQEVLLCWQGLGYNRRGLALHAFAQRVVTDFEGIVPDDPEILQSFVGIGPNTAGSICAFAFNKPIVFIETNLRTVFLHEFFQDKGLIHDKELLALIEQTVDHSSSRDWYYALMDYGVHLKTKHKVSNKQSKHYVKQSTFIGSRRQVRGLIVRVLSRLHSISREALLKEVAQELPNSQHDVPSIIDELQKEGFLKMDKQSNIIFI